MRYTENCHELIDTHVAATARTTSAGAFFKPRQCVDCIQVGSNTRVKRERAAFESKQTKLKSALKNEAGQGEDNNEHNAWQGERRRTGRGEQ